MHPCPARRKRRKNQQLCSYSICGLAFMTFIFVESHVRTFASSLLPLPPWRREREKDIENEGAMQAHTYPVMEVVGRLLLLRGERRKRGDGMALAIPLAQKRRRTICPPPPPLSVVVTTWTERSWKKNIISLFGGSCELDIFSFLHWLWSFHSLLYAVWFTLTLPWEPFCV